MSIFSKWNTNNANTLSVVNSKLIQLNLDFKWGFVLSLDSHQFKPQTPQNIVSFSNNNFRSRHTRRTVSPPSMLGSSVGICGPSLALAQSPSYRPIEHVASVAQRLLVREFTLIGTSAKSISS